MEFFKEELQKTFDDIPLIREKKYFGKTLMGRASYCEDRIIKISLQKEKTVKKDDIEWDIYSGYLVEIVDQTKGLIDSQTFLFIDFVKRVLFSTIIGKRLSKPYIRFDWMYDEDGYWAGLAPSQKIDDEDRKNIANAVSDYLSSFTGV